MIAQLGLAAFVNTHLRCVWIETLITQVKNSQHHVRLKQSEFCHLNFLLLYLFSHFNITNWLLSFDTKLIFNFSKLRLLLQSYLTMSDRDNWDYKAKKELSQCKRSCCETFCCEAHHETLKIIHEMSTLLIQFSWFLNRWLY